MENAEISSLKNFIAWWSIVREEAEEAIKNYESKKLVLLRDGEDVSHKASSYLAKVVRNMDALILQANRDIKIK